MTTVPASPESPSSAASAPAPAGPSAGRPFPALRELGPNWYAAVMGTSIVAGAGTGLPVHAAWLRAVCTAVWVLAVLMLAGLLTARALHWVHHGDRAREHLLDPAVAPFYGCPTMALLSVGSSTLTAGAPLIGQRAALALDGVLYTVGAAAALVVAVVGPYLMMTRHRVEPGSASPAWLLPVVSPMVAATSGAALVPHLPAGAARESLLLALPAMFGMSLLLTLALLPAILTRLIVNGPLPLPLTPLVFLVLGPLGQSTTATDRIAVAAQGAVHAPYTTGFTVFALLYGVPVTGFALMWLTLSAALLVRGLRRGMGFTMTWWALTFPVGTCATGATGLAERTGLGAVTALAVALYVLLVAGWTAAVTGTLREIGARRLLAA